MSSLLTTGTAEQQAIFAHLRDTSHLIVDAKAGSGKTSTIVASLPLLKGTTSLQAFNRSIADELKQRVGAMGILVAANVQVSTVHSHGLSAFRRAGYKTQTLSGKLNFMLRDQAKMWKDSDPLHANTRHIANLVSMAKSAGFGLHSEGENFPAIGDHDAWEALITHFNLDSEFVDDVRPDAIIAEAQDLLIASNKRLLSIDFDDMIYLPLLHNLPIPQYNNVVIDEAQDINATRRELAFRSVLPDGRIIAVGDPNQAIYGFTGASIDSLDAIRRRLVSPITLPLSICWRCDSAIIEAAQALVPTIRARPNAGQGLVDRLSFRSEGRKLHADEMEELNNLAFLVTADMPMTTQQTHRYDLLKRLRDGDDFLAEPRPGDAILCRLNRPNVAACLGLLRRGTPARIEGRDIGRKLLDHVKKATELYALQPLTTTLLDLDIYCEQQIAILHAKEREAAAALLLDEVEAIKLIIERCLERDGPHACFAALEALVETLFGDNVKPSAVVTLSSVHKAKGREWKRVFILGRYDYMPFHRAESPWELEQEDNLIYVAITRAERHLTMVTGVQSAIDQGLHRLPPLRTTPAEGAAA